LRWVSRLDAFSGYPFRIQGSRQNKFAFLGVEAPVWQGAKVQEYRDIHAL
jgi:hypothetical protein